MELDRELLIIVSVSFIVLWVLGKRLLGRNRGSGQSATTHQKVETWYRQARDQLELIDEELRAARSQRWDSLSRDEQLSRTDAFLRGYFGREPASYYTAEERLQIGKVWFTGRPEEETESQIETTRTRRRPGRSG